MLQQYKIIANISIVVYDFMKIEQYLIDKSCTKEKWSIGICTLHMTKHWPIAPSATSCHNFCIATYILMIFMATFCLCRLITSSLQFFCPMFILSKHEPSFCWEGFSFLSSLETFFLLLSIYFIFGKVYIHLILTLWITNIL